ncbi:hypothetical protein EYF80_060458 [Liparis tanakae]|uniref:Uncharacterized protein n=1 Tax=Liparis tanakae TaxID=230148 RepID=A0A4Z2ELT1_9TELE|nr:hypothetical protein EYF80_060458 [Liparis tanakae]
MSPPPARVVLCVCRRRLGAHDTPPPPRTRRSPRSARGSTLRRRARRVSRCQRFRPHAAGRRPCGQTKAQVPFLSKAAEGAEQSPLHCGSRWHRVSGGRPRETTTGIITIIERQNKSRVITPVQSAAPWRGIAQRRTRITPVQRNRADLRPAEPNRRLPEERRSSSGRNGARWELSLFTNYLIFWDSARNNKPEIESV